MTTQIEPCDRLNEAWQSLIGINELVQTEMEARERYDTKYVKDLLGISTSLLEAFSDKQPVSRRQRDLSGSTVRRNYGTAVAFSVAGINYLMNPVDDVQTSDSEISNKIQAGMKVVMPVIDTLLDKLSDKALEYRHIVMEGKTHGQVAIPTMLGKEVGNFAYRAYLQRKSLAEQLKQNNGIGVLRALKRINDILLGFAQDTWQYISDEYFLQIPKKGETGSSTLAQKVNPIDFENGEGNIILANSLLKYFSRRMMSAPSKALHDNIGMPLGYSLIAYRSILDGMDKIRANPEHMLNEVKNHWEVLAEPIQQLLRKAGVPDAYEAVKDLTRGQKITPITIISFVESRKDLDGETRKAILELKPEKYFGDAVNLTEKYMLEVRNYLAAQPKA